MNFADMIKSSEEGKDKRNEKGETYDEYCKRVENEKKELTRVDVIDALAYASTKLSKETDEPVTILIGAAITHFAVKRLFDEEEGEE